MKRHTARNEFGLWENLLEYMYKILNDKDIPDDSGITIEQYRNMKFKKI